MEKSTVGLDDPDDLFELGDHRVEDGFPAPSSGLAP